MLLTTPSEAWRATLDKSLLPRLQILIAELHMKAEEEQKALAYVEAVAAQQPKAALNLANDILRSWARNHDPNPPNQMNRYGPYGMVLVWAGKSLWDESDWNTADSHDASSESRRVVKDPASLA